MVVPPNPQKQVRIDPLSACALFVHVTARGNRISNATGFVVEHASNHYLVTNWHVVSGRNAETEELLSKTGAIPDAVTIFHHAAGPLGTWVERTERVIDQDDRPLWIEHPAGHLIDVVLLPLTNIDGGIRLFPFNLALKDIDMVPEVAMPASIIGFPLGVRTGEGWPIWKTGHIASDPDVDFDARPAFLIDATTREGMSGAPVVLRSSAYQTRDGSRVTTMGHVTLFLGVYSGRIRSDIEVGRVWRPSVLDDILMCR